MTDDHEFAARAARIRAAYHRLMAQTNDVAASAHRFSAALERLGQAVQAGTDREIAEHPDLAELNVVLDNYYDKP
ncbi:hypothetical protein ABZ135_18505 [Streptomyces sp. NPDC006339]|uniref:hypothetical protein n=1 Tax=Streptomyces sp. NPDC006339 TaxID=3156755 RepID=UPI0033AA1743